MKFQDYNKQPVELVQHCFDMRVLHGEDLKIHIGTDSVADGGLVYYFTVVAFRYGNQGVHFIFSAEKVQSYRTETGKPDLFTRLLRECQLTVHTALLLNGIPKEMIVLEFDYNNLVETVSNRLVTVAKSWALGYDFKFLMKYKENAHKPDQWESQIAVKAANHLCQSV